MMTMRFYELVLSVSVIHMYTVPYMMHHAVECCFLLFVSII